MKALKRDGISVESVTDDQFKELCNLIDMGKTAKESIPEVLTWLAKNEDCTVQEALDSLGLSMMSKKELVALVDEVLEQNSEFIEHRGKGALSAVMGIIMKKARGRVKPKDVNEILKEKLVN